MNNEGRKKTRKGKNGINRNAIFVSQDPEIASCPLDVSESNEIIGDNEQSIDGGEEERTYEILNLLKLKVVPDIKNDLNAFVNIFNH